MITLSLMQVILSSSVIKTGPWNRFSCFMGLSRSLNSFGDRQELIDKLIAIASKNGYCLSDRDIEHSIQQHTQGSQTNYICLPIGCWRVS